MLEYEDYDESAEKNSTVSYGLKVKLIFAQANRTDKVVRAVVDGIVILAMPGGDSDRAEREFYQSQHARLETFLTENNPQWAAHKKAWQEQEGAKAEATLLKDQAEYKRRINEWALSHHMPLPDGRIGPKQFDHSAWNKLVDGVKNDRDGRCYIDYIFWMAFSLESDYVTDPTSVTKQTIKDADRIADRFGLSGSATVEAMKLLVGVWPFGQRLLDTYLSE